MWLDEGELLFSGRLMVCALALRLFGEIEDGRLRRRFACFPIPLFACAERCNLLVSRVWRVSGGKRSARKGWGGERGGKV